MVKFVGNVVNLDELKKIANEGYTHITEQGYALSDDEEISTDDAIIANEIARIEEKLMIIL